MHLARLQSNPSLVGIDYATAKAAAGLNAFLAKAFNPAKLLFALIVVCAWLKEVTNISLVAYTHS